MRIIRVGHLIFSKLLARAASFLIGVISELVFSIESFCTKFARVRSREKF